MAPYKEIRATVSDGFNLALLRVIAKQLLNSYPFPSKPLKDLYSFDASTNEGVADYIDQAPQEEVHQLLLDTLVAEDLGVTSWKLDHEDEEDCCLTLKALASATGVDRTHIRVDITAKAEQEEADPAGVLDAAEADEGGMLVIGDRVRVKDDAKGRTGMKRKVAGREGVISGIKTVITTS